MRAWVCLLLSLFLLPELFAQCNYAPVYSYPFRDTFLDLAVDGNDLWTATSYGVSLYDRSVDPPAFVATLAVPGATRVVRVGNGVVYAGSSSSIAIIRKNGRALQLVRMVNAGATVNDIVATLNDLYVASSNGLTQWDLLDPTNPTKTQATLTTSNPNVQSLTLLGSTLYAADGDSTIAVYDISVPSLPQSIGTLNSSIPRPASVRTANGKLYVSDGRQSELWNGVGAGLTKLASLAFGAAAVAQISGDAVFVGGADRTLRAYDLSFAATPVGLFSTVIASPGGTINRITALATANRRLYAAAGDAGLLTYDLTSFASPFPMRSYPVGASTSIAAVGNHVYVTKAAGGITEFGQSADGSLVQQRSWDGSHTDLVFDGNNGFLMSTSGATMTLWTTQSTIPASISTATFRAAVVDAVMVGLTAYAVLSDRTLWTADLTLASPTPTQVAVNASPTSIARSGSGFAVADPRSDGTTTVVYFTDATHPSAPINVPGVTTTPVALSGSTAAVFTFRGITLIDFGSGQTSVLPQSGTSVARGLALSATSVFELTDAALTVWDRATQRSGTQYGLPSTPASLVFSTDAGAPIADVTTSDGIASIALNAATQLPLSVSGPNPNAFYKKVVATTQRVLLSDLNSQTDIYTPAMHHTGTIRAAGMADVAATPSGTYVLFANRTIGGYSIDGLPLRQTTLNDTTDTQPLGIDGVGNAVWVSYARGCLTSVCEKRTNVYDASLSQTATFSGAIVDVVLSGNRAWVVTDLPAEIRVYDITDPLHPTQLASRATEGTMPANGIAVSGNTVYVIGDLLYAYDASSLAKSGTSLSAFAPDPTNGITAVDQHIRTDGPCAMITGRGFDAALFPPGFASGTPIGGPSVSRSVAQQPGVFYVLTDNSLEIVSNGPMPSPPRRHAAK